MKRTKNNVKEYYLSKTYPVLVYRADDGGYVAEIEELPGCITQGETLEEVYERIEDARQAWIEVACEDGIEIPLPRTEQEYSGKFVIRLPKYLHRRLSQQAVSEGVSLNQYVVSLLSSSVSIHEVILTVSDIKGVKERIVGSLSKTIMATELPRVATTAFCWQSPAVYRERVFGKDESALEFEEIAVP